MTQALELMLQHAEQARDRAQAEWQTAQARLQAQLQQAQQLRGYQQETRDRDPARLGQITGIDAVLVHRSFMQRLQQAVDLQQSQLELTQLQVQALKTDLLAREMRVAQVQKLQQRRSQETLRQQGRQEQRLQDDRASAHLQSLLHKTVAEPTAPGALDTGTGLPSLRPTPTRTPGVAPASDASASSARSTQPARSTHAAP